MSDQDPGPIVALPPWGRPDPSYEVADAVYGDMIAALRDFHNKVAAARPDEAALKSLTQDLEAWTERLAAVEVPESRQVFGRRFNLPDRGQSVTAAFTATHMDDTSVRGVVNFGRYFMGGNRAAHGGTIPLLFDSVLGHLCHAGGRPMARTAYLHTDYRSITPIETDLQLTGWFVSEAGRKRLLRGELRNGDVLCCEVEGLFVALNPGQP
jgi:hypothetical protein